MKVYDLGANLGQIEILKLILPLNLKYLGFMSFVSIVSFIAIENQSNTICTLNSIQRRIQKTVKHIRCSVLRKKFATYRRSLFSQKHLSIIYRVLNTQCNHLHTTNLISTLQQKYTFNLQQIHTHNVSRVAYTLNRSAML